jgi:hypothetical protein
MRWRGSEKVPDEGPGFRLMQVSRGSEIFVRPEEAQIGKRVRVRKDHRKAELQSRVGTIAQRWGNPGHPALDVLLDEGEWQLFWYHELEPLDDDDSISRLQNGATAGT